MFEATGYFIMGGVYDIASKIDGVKFKYHHKKMGTTTTTTKNKKSDPKPVQAKKVEIKTEQVKQPEQKESENIVKINVDISADQAKNVDSEKIKEQINSFIDTVGEEQFAMDMQNGNTSEFEKFVRTNIAVEVGENGEAKSINVVDTENIIESDATQVEKDNKVNVPKNEISSEEHERLRKAVKDFVSLPAMTQSIMIYQLTIDHWKDIFKSIKSDPENETNNAMFKYLMLDILKCDPNKHTEKELDALWNEFVDENSRNEFEYNMSSAMGAGLHVIESRLSNGSIDNLDEEDIKILKEISSKNEETTVLDLQKNVVEPEIVEFKPLITFEEDPDQKEEDTSKVKEVKKKPPITPQDRKKPAKKRNIKKTVGETTETVKL